MPFTSDLLAGEDGNLRVGRMPAHDWAEPTSLVLRSRPREGDAPAASGRGLTLGGLIKPTDQQILVFTLQPRWGNRAPHGRRIRPSQHILEGFLGLGSASNERIQAFAKRYGPLLIYCKTRYRNRELIVTEECSVWRYFAKSLKAMLSIAAGLQISLPGQDLKRDWDILAKAPLAVRETEERDDRPDDLLKPTPLHPEREWAARAYFVSNRKHRHRVMWLGLLNCLLELGRVRPWLLWDGSATENLPHLVFSGPNLLSYLSIQVCLSAAKQDSFAMCTYCQMQYTPKRAPKVGQRNYCPECRKEGIPVRMAQRARLARKRRTGKSGRN
jgi:hypothetical protein